jgi:hypothetical protein
MSAFSDSAIQFSIRWPLHQQETVEIGKLITQLGKAINPSAQSCPEWRSVHKAIGDSFFHLGSLGDFASLVCTTGPRRYRSSAEIYREKWQKKLGCFHEHFCSYCHTAEAIVATGNASHRECGPQEALAGHLESLARAAWALDRIEQGYASTGLVVPQATREMARALRGRLKEHIGTLWHVPFDAEPEINKVLILPSGCSSRDVSQSPSPTFSIPPTVTIDGTQATGAISASDP